MRMLTFSTLHCRKVMAFLTRVAWFLTAGAQQQNFLTGTFTNASSTLEHFTHRTTLAVRLGRSERLRQQHQALETRYKEDRDAQDHANRKLAVFDRTREELMMFFDLDRQENRNDHSELRQMKHLSDSGNAIVNAMRILISAQLKRCVKSNHSRWFKSPPTNIQLLITNSSEENYRGLLKLVAIETLLQLTPSNIGSFEKEIYTEFKIFMDSKKRFCCCCWWFTDFVWSCLILVV